MKKGLSILLAILSSVTALSVATVFTLQATGVIDVFASNVRVEFRNYDNSLLWRSKFPVGSTVKYEGATPVRESTDEYDYTFVSWDKSLYNVTKDTVYHAQFQNTPRQYKVVFQNWNQKELYSTYVVGGQSAVYIGATPTRNSDEKYSYTFKGWDKELSNIREDTIFTAQFDEEAVNYKVVFLNYNGDLLYIDYVVGGGTAKYGGIEPTHPGDERYDYVFTGWDMALTNITYDFYTTAVFEKQEVKYEVKFYNYDNTYLYTDKVAYNGTAVYDAKIPTRPSEGEFDYTFSGWNKPLTNVTANMDVIAQFETNKRTFVIEFYNYDGTYLYTANAEWHQPAFYNGEVPTHPDDEMYTYEFDEWDRDISSVEDNIVTYAKFKKELRKFKCIYKNYNGDLLYVGETRYGETSKYLGATPTKTSDGGTHYYKFVGWDNDEHNITQDTIFIAQYEAVSGGMTILKDVEFYNYDGYETGDLLDADVIEGDTVYYHGYEPTREGTYNGGSYTFVGWSRPTDEITESTLLFAQYQVDTMPTTYIVTYRGYLGELLYEDYVQFGGSSSYKGTFYDYLLPENGFLGWDLQAELNYITHSITVFPIVPESEAI